MLTIIEIIAAILLLYLISYLLGTLLNEKGCFDAFRCIPAGFFLMLSVLLFTSLPCIFLGASATLFTVLNCVVLLGLCVFSVYRLVKNEKKNAVSFSDLIPYFEIKNVYFWIAAALIIFETVFLGIGMHIDNDDSFYVATATTSVATDSLYVYDPYTGDLMDGFPARYVLSPFPLLGVFFGKLLSLNPTVFFHTAIPFFVLPAAYMIYYLMGAELFPGGESAADKRGLPWLFTGVLALVNMFSYFSTWSFGIRLLLRPWQGKTVMACLIVPFIFYLYLKKYRRLKFEKNDYFLLLVAMLAGCFVSSMGIFLPALELGILSLITLFRERSIKSFLSEIVMALPNLFLAVVYLFIR